MADAQVLAKVPQRYFDAWNGRDPHALDDFFAPSFTWTDPLLPAPLDSIQGAQAFMAGTWGGFSNVRFELLGGALVDEANGQVAQIYRMTGTHDGEFSGIPPTGKTFDLQAVDAWKVGDGGQVTSMQAYYDSVSLMRQLGLA